MGNLLASLILSFIYMIFSTKAAPKCARYGAKDINIARSAAAPVLP